MVVVNGKGTTQPPASAVETFTVKVDGDNIFVRKAGQGPPVLLLHGGASDSADWAGTMVPLSSFHTFYAPDLIGFGSSDRNRDGYQLSHFTESAGRLIETLGLATPLPIVGHSLGGRIALDLALRQPDKVHRLALVDTAGFTRLAHWGNLLGTAAFAIRRLLRRPQPYPRFMMENGAMPHWLCLDQLHRIKVPILMVWSSHDPYYSVKGAMKARELMPQARLEILPGYGHAPHRTETESFNRLLAGFLDQP